jgi:hypothetical protein
MQKCYLQRGKKGMEYLKIDEAAKNGRLEFAVFRYFAQRGRLRAR